MCLLFCVGKSDISQGQNVALKPVPPSNLLSPPIKASPYMYYYGRSKYWDDSFIQVWLRVDLQEWHGSILRHS